METKNSAKKCQTLVQAEEEHLAEMSSASTTKTTTKTKKTTKKSLLQTTVSQSIEEGCVVETDEKSVNGSKKKSATMKKTELEQRTVSVSSLQTSDNQDDLSEPVGDSTANANGKKKTKSKKGKKNSTGKQNISVKSSFSKFDALEKRNVRSSDDGKTSEKFTVNPQEIELVCRLCQKPVYKMEEIKAEKSIFHKNCFRCHECNKQLKLDNYQSHESVVYCLVHFKMLFAPKSVEEVEPLKPCKPELIIRENQPLELPPDVVRASDKPDLGLEELQQLNVRSRFQVFENGAQKKDEPSSLDRTNLPVKRSTSIITKLAKLQALGFSTDLSVNDLAAHVANSSANSSSDEDSDNGEEDIDLIRSKKKTQRDCPVGLGRAMSDIKSKFESGHIMSKEERREERKQEIQNIRSRLFMGKQARIKEMYQQAVADSEQSITASSKKPDVEIGDGAARNMKDRFEKGVVFRKSPNDTGDIEPSLHSGLEKEADVFESAMSKNSRSIFMELDANVSADKNNVLPLAPSLSRPNMLQKNQAPSNRLNESEQENIVKYDEKPEDVKIETSDVSSKFKFFETYRPTESKRKVFRITPPREGVVKLPSPDESESDNKDSTRSVPDANILEKSQTTALMLNKFREMEQNENKRAVAGPRPLKSFTPPPDEGRRLYQDQDSDDQSEDDDYDDDIEEEEEEEDNLDKYDKKCMNDEALREAQAAARAKQLRAKFEKWESSETQREQKDGQIDIYSDQVSDQSNIESTKTIRERFENMKNLERNSSGRPRYQVNRFV